MDGQAALPKPFGLFMAARGEFAAKWFIDPLLIVPYLPVCEGARTVEAVVMSTAHCDTTNSGIPHELAVPAAASQPLNRLALVRRNQGISRRTVARRMNVDIELVRQQECETTDLPLSVLYAWQKALDVPLNELLAESGDSLVSPVLERSQLVRLMKTVLAMREQARQESIRRMAQTMCDQLVEIMPELANIGPWHAVGKRRRLSELGVAAQRRLTEDVFVDRDD
jgi:transcriptional regulator with XRE-family HTH domain